MKNFWFSLSLFFVCSFSFGQGNTSVDTLWDSLIKSNLCIGGFQHVNEKTVKIESSEIIVNNNNWKSIISQPKSKITPFLISKFTDTLKTNLHTCPFFKTRRNELAVYLLQHIYRKNWYDFTYFHEYKKKKTTGSNDQPQIWLQNILANEKKRDFLIKSWLRELKNSSEE